MVIKMNKELFIEKLLKKTNFSLEKCCIIQNIIANNSIIGRKNKEKIINELISKLSLNQDTADEVYNICMEIILLDR